MEESSIREAVDGWEDVKVDVRLDEDATWLRGWRDGVGRMVTMVGGREDDRRVLCCCGGVVGDGWRSLDTRGLCC